MVYNISKLQKDIELEYLNEEELRTEIINIQKSMKLKKLKADYALYLEDPIANADYKDNMPIFDAFVAMGYVENYSREKYGQMVLKLVEKICLKGSFAGYSYRDDFYSNAIQRVLSYSLTNFNPDMISKRSGNRVKAFAYLTSIINNAIVEIINERKAEHNDLVEKLLPLDNLYNEVSKHHKPQLRRADDPKDVPSVSLKVVEGNVVDGNESTYGAFVTVYDVLSQYTKEIKIKFEYPSEYSMSLEEADSVYALGFDYLNLHKFEKEKYKPQFPKKGSEEKEDLFESWE